MSSFDEDRFEDLEEELIFKITNYLKIAATKTIPTNIRKSLAYSRSLFVRAKHLDALRRKEIELSIEKLKREEKIKEIQRKLEQNEQNLAEIEAREKMKYVLKIAKEIMIWLDGWRRTSYHEREQKMKQSGLGAIEMKQYSLKIKHNEQHYTEIEQLLKQSKPNFTEINQKLNQNEPTLKEIEQKLKLLKVDSKSNESEKIVSVEFQLIASEMLKNQLCHDNGMGWD